MATTTHGTIGGISILATTEDGGGGINLVTMETGVGDSKDGGREDE
jgi:hypothetical protein